MSLPETNPPAGEHGGEREIGRFDMGRAGPLFVAVGGIHGNEPAGIAATQAVLGILRKGQAEEQVNFAGRLVGLRGNLAALEIDERFVKEDLNRIWTAENVAALDQHARDQDEPDEAELRCLVETFGRLFAEPIGGQAPTQVIVLDLHSTSGPSTPFLCMADTLQNRRIGFALGVPVILGLEEALPGTMLDYMSEAGHVAIAFEGGSHACEEIVRSHQAALTCGLVAGGLLGEGLIDVDQERALLEAQTQAAPAIVEILERHGTSPLDGFEMDADWSSFDPVSKGERLAKDNRGLIEAKRSGRLLLPRYQDQGDDGFFISRDVRPFWLSVSAWLRRLGAERLLPFLPGVKRIGGHLRELHVSRKRARFGALQVFHLFGYRRFKADAEHYVFVRRPDSAAELK